MPLTHVCMWTEHEWKRVSAQEAVRYYGKTVSASDRLFMCELCGQYVTLAYGWIREPYFKHSSQEANKDCSERSFSQYYSSSGYTFQPIEHELPLRLKILTSTLFKLELGLPPVRNSQLEKYVNQKIVISSPNNRKECTYSLERINDRTTTYLSIGNMLCEKYCITLFPEVPGLTFFWPKIIAGVSKQGAVFDSITGKKLPYDADAIVNHEYYLLTTELPAKWVPGMTIERFCQMTVSYTTWYIYRIVANTLEQSAAKFFLKYHCRLTDQAIRLTPVWPVYVEIPYGISLCHEQMTLFFRGNASPTVYPNGFMKIDACERENEKVLFIQHGEEVRLLAVGRNTVLKYRYLCKESLNDFITSPQISVIDLAGTTILPGNQTELPQKKTIQIRAPFDGNVLKKCGNVIIERYSLRSEIITEVERIQLGQSIEIFQGLDLIWSVHYTAPAHDETEDEKLYQQLMVCCDELISVPHTLGALAKKMSAFPKTKKWLYYHIRSGKMSRKAYNVLIHFFATR